MGRRTVVLLTVLAAAVLPAAAQAATGFGADGLVVGGAVATAPSEQLAATGARWLRIDVHWSAIAPQRPARPRRQYDPAYQWGALDRQVRALRRLATGPGGTQARFLLAVGDAPAWAASPGASVQPAAFGAFMTALARRYRRRVDAYEIWPEPNTAVALAPQRAAGRLVAPAVFAALVRTAAREIAKVSAAPVVAGGLARTGAAADTPPGAFLRALGRVGLPQRVALGLRLAPGGAEAPAADADDLSLAELDHTLAAVDAAFPRRARRVWVTGYAVPSSAGDGAQADGVRTLLAAAALPRIRVAIWERLVDGTDSSTGLLLPPAFGYAAKPAAAAWAPPG